MPRILAALHPGHVASALTLAACLVLSSPPSPAETAGLAPAHLPIVYNWSERSSGQFVLKGHTMTALDNYDPLPDVAFVTSGFKEANIVDRSATGEETTLFDCIGNPDLHCAALDPKVSPDNTRIAFAVLYGKQIGIGRWTIHGTLPIPVVNGVDTGQIFIYDTRTKQLAAWPRVEGTIDAHPEWISNDELVFVSDRAKVYPVMMYGKSPTYRQQHALQRWKARVDGSQAINIGPHDDMALHPLVLSDGNILTATWRVDEKLHHKVTAANQYWMTMTDQFGANEFTVLGAHETKFSQGQQRYDALIALHFYGERSNGDLMSANYYRGRHMGLGMPIAFPRLPHGVEGSGQSFLPDIYPLLPWAQEEDNPTHRDKTGRFMGKGGYPVGLPHGEVLLTKGTGFCYEGLRPEQANDAYLNGPGCDTGIYVLKSVPSGHPDDLVKVVDRPDRHEFAADIRLPYKAVYGRDAPAKQTRADQGFCSLGVVNVRQSLLRSGGPACSKTGACIDAGRTAAEIDRIAIYEAIPNRARQRELKGFPVEGQELRLLGHGRPEQDGSLNVRIPCETPYKLRAIDARGNEFIRDQIKHSNRSGEQRLCLGCHAGHTMSDHVADVPQRFARTIAGGKPARALEKP